MLNNLRSATFCEVARALSQSHAERKVVVAPSKTEMFVLLRLHTAPKEITGTILNVVGPELS